MRLTKATAHAQAVAFGGLLDDGILRLYDGAPPEDVDDPLTDQRVLAEGRFDVIAFDDRGRDGVIVLATGIFAVVTSAGRASWFRALRFDGKTVVVDGTIGISDDADLILDDAVLGLDQVVQITEFEYTIPSDAPARSRDARSVEQSISNAVESGRAGGSAALPRSDVDAIRRGEADWLRRYGR